MIVSITSNNINEGVEEVNDILMITIMQGIPGSGKSTIAKKLFEMDPNAEIASADDFFIQEDGSYVFDITKLGEAHRKCQEKVKKFLENNKNVIIDNTNIKKKDVKIYLDMAKEFGAEVQVIRVKSNFKSIHNVPQEVIERMDSEMEDILS
jgi:predicted kinase